MLFIIKLFLLSAYSLFFFFSFYSQVQAQEHPTETLLLDNFEENNLNNWEINAGHWDIENGTLIGSHIGQYADGIISTKNTKSYDWNNYTVEFDLNSYIGVDGGIYFRESESGNAYIFNLRHGTNFGAPEIKFFKQFNHIPILISSKSDLSLNNEKWYHIRLVVFNENIKLYVNNVKYFDYNDPGTTIRKGRVTFTYWTGAFGSARIGIDNVKILSLNPTIPFLDLPWDYGGKGLSFNEAALAINSFFDHQYPLLGRGLDLPEPATTSASIVDYLGRTTNNDYTKHDGYDYGNVAKAKLNDQVLAAASGSATYIDSCSSCGNMIVIDHGNGYQTRYMHLQKDGLIIDTPNQPTPVSSRQQIGKVGFSGNVWPNDERGAHIHFGVFQDKNGDGNFNDNEPDGVTDPFGWQSKNPDPWEIYSFFYLGQNRTGNKSYYLWKNNLANMTQTITPSGAIMNVGSFTLTFPPNATNKNIIINAKSAPVVKPSNNLTSAGSSLLIDAIDTSGIPVTQLQNLSNISLDFSTLDISKLKKDTLSFYSSLDGTNWVKENTSFPNQTTAQAQINHLSYFALIGERKDTTPPTTTAVLSGTQGQPSWFKSDVQLALDAQDNEGGLGIEYTLYRTNEGEAQEYKTPLSFTNEGHYKVQFYSADNDDNVEEEKFIEFNIDKTPPHLSLGVSTQTLWPPNGKMVPVNIISTSNDDNLYQTEISVDDEYNQVEPTFTMSESDFSQTVQLEAKRKGDDLDGRTYLIKGITEDLAGNTESEQIQVLVPHDARN